MLLLLRKHLKRWKTITILFLKIDILLLTVLFEIFRLNSFELDPVNLLSTPGYIWDKVLKFANIWLKNWHISAYLKHYEREGISITR